MKEARIRVYAKGFWQTQKGKRYRKIKHVAHSVPINKLMEWRFGNDEKGIKPLREFTWDITFERSKGKHGVVPVLILRASP